MVLRDTGVDPGGRRGLGRLGRVVEYDIQTTCPEVVEELNLKSLRLGDVIAIPGHYGAWGRGRY